VVYLFVDGLAERLHLGHPREAVLAAWGVLTDGNKVLLHLAPGTKKDTARLPRVLPGLRWRGLPDRLAPRGVKRSRGRPVWGLFHAVVPAPLHPVGRYSRWPPQRVERFSPVQIKGYWREF
jgi:hypothetical protein